MKMFRTYVASCLLLVCNAVFAQTFTNDFIYYEVLDGGTQAQVTGIVENSWGTVIIPETVTYEGKEYSVVAVADYAFEGCGTIYGAILPNSVTSVGMCAFRGCHSLKTVTFGEGLTSIGIEAFYQCLSLAQVEFMAESMEEIGVRAFSECGALQTIVLPNSVYTIGNHVFKGCYNLISAVLPETITGSMSTGVFSECTALQNVTMPSYVTKTISPSIFENCYNLRYLHFLNPNASKFFQFFQTFAENKIEGVNIIVPDGCVDAYSEYWSEWPVYENSVYTLNKVTIPQIIDQLYSMIHFNLDFSEHGLLTSPEQISTNKLEPTEGSIAALLDNNKETYFHSTWSVANESLDNYHYLEVDLEKAVKEITLQFARRSHNTVSCPEVIHVYATNDPNGEWMDMGRDTCYLNRDCYVDEGWAYVRFPQTMQGCQTGSSTVIELNDAYRYLRFEVEKSYAPNAGVENLNNIYFTLAELAIRESFNGYKIDLDEILTPQGVSDMFTDIWYIQEASWNFECEDSDVDVLNMWINRIQEGIETGVNQVTVMPATIQIGIYSIDGKLVKQQGNNLNDLPKGIYIVNGKKVVK